MGMDKDYYKSGGISAMDYIAAHDLNFCKGNAIKYITRAGKKPGVSARDDLFKAIDYLMFEIEKTYEVDKDGED